jgi:methyltransferase (TIGR00027 family)
VRIGGNDAFKSLQPGCATFYDSHAYRVDLPERVKTFEVDHPVTQADKLEKVRKIFGKVPEQVRYVPVDFNSQSLSERLLSSDYDPGLISLFVWQGVTMYLESDAVDATLAFIEGLRGR